MLAFTVSFLTACFPVWSQAYIQGQLKGYGNEQLFACEPVNGFANSTLIKEEWKIPLDTEGKFNYIVDIKDPCFVTLKINYEPIWLLLQPGDSLDIYVDLKALKNNGSQDWLQITGNNSAGHLYFNKYNFLPYNKFIPIIDLFESIKQKPPDLVKSISDTLLKSIAPFDVLLEKRLISSSYYTIVTKTIKANLLNESLKFFFRGNRSLQSLYPTKEIQDIKNRIFAICNPSDTMLYKGLQTNFYIYSYYLQKELDYKQKKLQRELRDSTLDLGGGKKLVVAADYIPFLHIRDRRLQEYMWGSTLYNISATTNTYPDLQSMEAFSQFFPRSQWLVNIARFEAQIRDKRKTNLKNTGEIKYLDSTQTILRFKEITDKLRGKPLFIDLWASWCVPCRQEFVSENSVDSFLNASNITKVFISIDNVGAKKSWKNAIELYGLSGYHILASPALVDELVNKIYNGDKIFPIPRYVIVNRNGTIVEREALRPSSDLELINQLKNKLQIN